jgi:hypothetical protein
MSFSSGAPAHYTVVSRVRTFCESVFVDLAEDAQGTEYEILTLYPPKSDLALKAFHRQLNHRLPVFKNLNVPGLQNAVEAGYNEQQGCFFTVYEQMNEYNPDYELAIAEAIQLAETLKHLKTQNITGFWLTPDWLGYDKSNERVCICWPGWFEILLTIPDLSKDHLPANVLEWVANPAKNQRPNHQDDMYQLCNMLTYLEGDYSFDTLKYHGLSQNRTERYKSYPDLIDGLKQLQEKLEPSDRELFFVQTKPEDRESFAPILEDMNIRTHLCVDAELSANKRCVKGKFTTPNWSGLFELDKSRNYIFIPYSSCRHHPNNSLHKDKNTFHADYEFVLFNPSSHNRRGNTEQVNAQELLTFKNKLAIRHRSQSELYKEWKTLPANEKKFTEEEAILCSYQKVEQPQGKKMPDVLEFLLCDELPHLEKIKLWKDSRTPVCVKVDSDRGNDYLTIGTIRDYNEKNRLLTIANLKCRIADLPESGKLEKDVRMEIIPFVKQMEACEAFQNARVRNPQLCSILTTPQDARFPAVPLPNIKGFESSLCNPKLKNDPAQLEAVLGALDHKPVYLIQGPPGTGKTTVIVELIQQLVRQNPMVRILVVSQSNMAVDNVLKRLIKTSVSFIRLASDYAIDNGKQDDVIKPHTYSAKLSRWSEHTIEASKQMLYSYRKQFTELEGIIKDWHSLVKNAQKATRNSTTQPDDFLLQYGSRQVNCLTAMLMQTQVVGSTCIHIVSSMYRSAELKFDFVIMDESSKATPAETLVPLSLGRNIILIGDHKQLPPVITQEEAIIEGIREELEDQGLDMNKTFGVSLFERLIKAFEKDPDKQGYVSCLNIQYRMPKQIGDLVSKHFYNGKLTTGGDEQARAHGIAFRKETAALFVDTSGHENPHDNDNPVKRQNACNVKVIQGILTELNKRLKGKKFTVGIIAAYRGQVEALNRAVKRDEYPNLTLDINTVDSFQGSERDVIIYDVVKSSRGQSNIGFQKDYRRLNVAMSRAQKLLLMVGDRKYLLERARFEPEGDFQEFKLRSIVQELVSQGYATTNFADFIL